MGEGGPISDSKPSTRLPRRLRGSLILFGFLLIVALIWFACRNQQSGFQWSLFAATFAQLDWGWFTAAVALVLLTYLGRAVRWQLMLRPIQPHPNFWLLLDSTIIGFTAVVLFGRAGELVRPYLISTREKVAFTSQLATWLLERIYDLLSVLLLFGFALTRITATSTKLGNTMEWVLSTGGNMAGILASVCLALLIVFGLFPVFVENRLVAALGVLPCQYQARITGLVKAFLSGTSSTRRGSFVFLLVFYTFCEWCLIVACFLCLFRAVPFTHGLGILDALIVVGFVAFGSALQIPGVGGGMQVATVLVLTELFQIPLESASGLAILIWVVTFVSVVPIGLLLALKDGLKWRKLLQTKEIQPL